MKPIQNLQTAPSYLLTPWHYRNTDIITAHMHSHVQLSPTDALKTQI